MKVIIVGASGDVGSAIVDAMCDQHELIQVGRNSGDIQIDVGNVEDIRAMYRKVRKVDGVISAVGHGHFGPVDKMTGDDFMKGIDNKLMPQINLVLEGLPYVRDKGSFTLTSGILNRDHISGGAAGAAANGAIDAFVKAASLEMPRGIRINTVSAGMLEVSTDRYAKAFPGHIPIPSHRVGMAYCKSAEGIINGEIIVLDA